MSDRFVLRGPFERVGQAAWLARGLPFEGDDTADGFRSKLRLFEDDRPLGGAHRSHEEIRRGLGGYSHWSNDLFFSTPDGSDPNLNGRVYAYDLLLSDTRPASQPFSGVKRWNLHPQADYFLAAGGDSIAPPLYCNLGLTNKCNLRCEICGSQKFLDASSERRRHMRYETFEAVAETLFPLLTVVELNSQGDPLLHPRIESILETIARHGCDVKIQHNGTLLTNRIIDLLHQQHGTIYFSLDAVGPKFDEVRRNGVWSKAAPGMERLLRERDPNKLSVAVYPTLTGRTIHEAENVANWCAEHGVDQISFHRFVPLAASWEVAPSEEDYAAVKARMREWCRERGDPLAIYFESECLNEQPINPRVTQHASAAKAPIFREPHSPVMPIEAGAPGGDLKYSCVAPLDYVEIGLEGQMGVCCRAQDVLMGYATSVESFAEAWLGRNYDLVRGSLRRSATGRYPLPNCEGCMKFFAPKAAGDRKGVDYSEPGATRSERLILRLPKVRVSVIQHETGFCYTSGLPVGVDASGMELWENDRQLGPAVLTHDEVRLAGEGRYWIGPNAIYFSASDGSDPARNLRHYELRRPSAAPAAPIVSERALEPLPA